MPYRIFLSVCATPLVLATAVAAPVQTDHVSVELVSETTAVVPGGSAWLGLHFVHEPHWHTYWINPGDSGLATKLSWSLPAGFRAGDIIWPAPQRFDVGGLFNFGYKGDIVLPLQLDVPADAKPGSTAQLAVEARWLVCREKCIPGKAALTLGLPIAAQAAADPHWQPAFAAARAALPQAAQWSGVARGIGDRIEITLRQAGAQVPQRPRTAESGRRAGAQVPQRPGTAESSRRAGAQGPGGPWMAETGRGADLPSAETLDAFVVQRQVVDYAPPRIERNAGVMKLTFAKSEYFAGMPAALDLLLIDGAATNVRAWSVRASFITAQPTP